MNTQEYWEKEAVDRALAIEQGAIVTTKDMIKLYEDAYRDIEAEIYKIRYNFAKRFGLDEDAANEYLDRELKKNNLEQLVTRVMNAEDEQKREDILSYIRSDGLSVRAYSAREERFRNLQLIINQRIRMLEAAATKILTEALKDTYKVSYYSMIDSAAKRFNTGFDFTLIPDEAIEEIVTAKWHGARFSERIWKNTERLSKKAQDIIVSGMISGQSEQKMTAALRREFDVSEFHASTLVRTETSHAQAMADLKGYKDMGIEKYKYLATLDERTCTVCQAHDGMIYNVSDAREGENYPTMHPRCRCTTVINLKLTRRSAREPISGKSYKVDGDLTYEQWYNGLSDEQRTALDTARNKLRNNSSDKRQYEQYKSVLGTKNVPKSFDKFQNLKYNDSEKYNFIKLDYRRHIKLINDPSLALPNAKNATADDRKFTEYLFGGVNEKGLAKGRAFTSRLGYDINNYVELKQEIIGKAERYPATLKNTNEHGNGYEQQMVLYGKNNTPANVIVAWKEKDGKTWLTSTYIKEVK